MNKVVRADQVLPAATELARRLADGATLAIRWTKFSVNKQLRHQMNLLLDTSLALESLTFLSQDHKEAVAAFPEKRKASFAGR